MKKQNTKTLVLGILTVIIILLTSLYGDSNPKPPVNRSSMNASLSDKALLILERKCNTCHRKQNPFMVFNRKNMNRKADKIYTAVFVQKRMPKKNGEPLSTSEYATLKNWVETTKSN